MIKQWPSPDKSDGHHRIETHICLTVPNEDRSPMKQIKCLTSLRFFAAAMIVIFHSGDVFGGRVRSLFSLEQGVSFFFVLSGFILTCVYPSLSGGYRIRDFYVARIARVWPAHFAAFLLLLCLIQSEGWGWNGTWQVVWANLFLVHSWIPIANYYFSFNSVSWSISTEAFFYLAFPFLIYRFDRSWWWKLPSTCILLVAVLCLATFWRVPVYSHANFSAVTTRGLAYISPFVRILEFVFGMTVASLCLRWRERKIVSSPPAWLWTSCELGALAIVAFCSWYCTRFDFQSQNVFVVYLNACGSFPAFGLLIGVLSFERGMVSRFLSMSWLVLLGEISYSIYLVHLTIFRFFSQNLPLFASLPKMVFYVAYWFAVLILSFIVWRVVEKPCQRWIRSLFSSKGRRAKTTAASAPAITNQ